MSRAARRPPRAPRKRNAFTQDPLFGEAAPAPSGRKPAHPKGEDPTIPHAKKFADGYRVWNPMIRAYVGDAHMQPFRDVGHASDMVRTLYVEMAAAGKGSRRVTAKAKVMREHGDLLSGPVAPRPTGEQTGFKFNGRRYSAGWVPHFYGKGASPDPLRDVVLYPPVRVEFLRASPDSPPSLSLALHHDEGGGRYIVATRWRERWDDPNFKPTDHYVDLVFNDLPSAERRYEHMRRHEFGHYTTAPAAKPNPYAVVDKRGQRAIPETFSSRTDAGLARRYIEASQGGGGLRVRATTATENARKRNGQVGQGYADLFHAMGERKKYLRQHLGAALKRVPGVSSVERQDKTSGAVQYKLAMPDGTAYVVLQSRFDGQAPAGPYAHVEVYAGRIGEEATGYALPPTLSPAEALRASVAHAARYVGASQGGGGLRVPSTTAVENARKRNGQVGMAEVAPKRVGRIKYEVWKREPGRSLEWVKVDDGSAGPARFDDILMRAVFYSPASEAQLRQAPRGQGPSGSGKVFLHYYNDRNTGPQRTPPPAGWRPRAHVPFALKPPLDELAHDLEYAFGEGGDTPTGIAERLLADDDGQGPTPADVEAVLRSASFLRNDRGDWWEYTGNVTDSKSRFTRTFQRDMRAIARHLLPMNRSRKANDGRHDHGHGRRPPPPDSFAIGRPVYADEARGPRSPRQRDEDYEAISMLKPNGRRPGPAAVTVSKDGTLTLRWNRNGHRIKFVHDLFSAEDYGEDTVFYVDGERVGAGAGPTEYSPGNYGFGDYLPDGSEDARFELVETLFPEAAKIALEKRAIVNSGEEVEGANPLAVAANDVREVASLAGAQGRQDLNDAATIMISGNHDLPEAKRVLLHYADVSTDARIAQRLNAAVEVIDRAYSMSSRDTRRKRNGAGAPSLPRGTLVLVEVVGSHPAWSDARVVRFTAVPPHYGRGRAPRRSINDLIAGAIGESVQKSPDAVVLRGVAPEDSGAQVGTRAVEALAQRLHGDPKAFRAQTSYAKRNGAARSRGTAYLQPTVERVGGALRFVSRHTPREWQALAIASNTDLPVSQFADAWVGQGIDLPEATAAISRGVTSPRDARRLRVSARQ